MYFVHVQMDERLARLEELSSNLRQWECNHSPIDSQPYHLMVEEVLPLRDWLMEEQGGQSGLEVVSTTAGTREDFDWQHMVVEMLLTCLWVLTTSAAGRKAMREELPLVGLVRAFEVGCFHHANRLCFPHVAHEHSDHWASL